MNRPYHPSGARGESREERSQLQNKRTAFVRMVGTPAFRTWLRMQGGRDALIREQVERAMQPSNLRVEVKDADGRWTEEDQ